MRPTRVVPRLPPRPAPLHRTIVLAPAPLHIAGWVARIALETGEEAIVVREVAAGNAVIIAHRRRLTRYKAALGLIAQHRDELGTIIGFAAQRLVGDDDRGSRHGGRRDAVE